MFDKCNIIQLFYIGLTKYLIMATVSFRLRSSLNKYVSIYVYLSLGRNEMHQSKTGFMINPKDWNSKRNKPKLNSAENKKTFSALIKLEKYLYDQINECQASGEPVNLFWLQNKISQCFNRVTKSDESFLTNHIQYIIDNAGTRKIKGSNKIGLSKRRVSGYKSFKKIIEDYQNKIKTQICFMDINKPFVEKFTNWLINERKYSINHSGKQIDNLKTVCIDAQSMEVKTNPFTSKIESFKERSEDRYIVTLSFNEIELIKSVKLESEALENVRKWLIIGCDIGQRASDLLRLTKKHIRFENGSYYIDIIQQKTKKAVTIGIGDEDVINIIKSGFPYKISPQKLNKHLKTLCFKAGITENIKGKKLDKDSNRKKLGLYPKNQLITSHTFRRSFATNYYKKIPTAVLINITGHSKESMFLEYINQRGDKDENADLFLKLQKELNFKKEPDMKVIKNVSFG